VRWLRRLWYRLRETVSDRAGRGDAELAAEIESHLRMQTEDNLRCGMPPEAARRAAVLKFGGVESTKEAYRDRRGAPLLEQTLQDLRSGVRQMVKNPVFTAVAVATLGIGIGANTAVFSIINAVLLADLPYPDPARLIMLTQSFPAIGEARLGVSPPEYLDYRDRARVFASIAGYSRTTFDITGDGESEPIDAVQATGSLFATLHVSPHIGRTFTVTEESIGAPKVVVLSFDFWQRRYAGDPQVLGRAMRLNEQLYTIVGVMPARFEFPADNASAQTPPAVWVPLSYTPRQLANRHEDSGTNVVARLARGVSLEQARDDVSRVADEFQREHPDTYSGSVRLRAAVDPLGADASRRARPALMLLGAAVGLVLLIACANVANLLLVRSSARQKEMAVRRALGAKRGRIVRQLLTEAVLMSGLGGLLGCVLSIGLIRATASLGQGQMLSVRGVQVDVTVLAFVGGISIVTGLLCGLAPAFEFGRSSVSQVLNRAGRQSGGGRERRRLQNVLVVFETASALVLLVGAALLAHSFVKVLSVPLGFDPEDALIVRTTFNRQRYPSADQRHRTQRLIVQRLAALPSVRAVGLTTHVPLADERTIGFALEREGPDQIRWAANALVSPEYFAAMGIPIVRGRPFNDADAADTPLVVVVNETLARRYWPNRDPIGEHVLWGGRRLMVVGVSGDVHIAALDVEVEPTIYCSVYQIESGATTSAVFILRNNGDSGAASTARAVIQSVDSGLPVFDMRPMTEVVGRSLAQRHLSVAVVAVFAGFALALAVIGLYAVLSQAVARRTQELGIRLAVGASPWDLITMVMRDGVRLVTAGLVIGGVAAVSTVRSMSVLLFGVNAVDPTAFAVAACTLLLVSLLATYSVARRAAMLDPITALRAE
jgi:macrolide transport system ATP-binding/permease protein